MHLSSRKNNPLNRIHLSLTGEKICENRKQNVNILLYFPGLHFAGLRYGDLRWNNLELSSNRSEFPISMFSLVSLGKSKVFLKHSSSPLSNCLPHQQSASIITTEISTSPQQTKIIKIIWIFCSGGCGRVRVVRMVKTVERDEKNIPKWWNLMERRRCEIHLFILYVCLFCFAVLYECFI